MRGRIAAVIYSTVAMTVSFAAWAMLSPMASTLQESYGLSITQKSVLVATPVILGSLMRIPMGVLTDRLGGKKIYTLTMLLLTIPLLGASVARSFASLLLCAFVLGMAGTTFAIAIAYVSRWFPPEKQGLVLGITAMGNLGTALASFTVPRLVDAYGVAPTFRIFSAGIAGMALLFWLGTREMPPAPAARRSTPWSVFRYKETWILSAFYFLTFGSFVAFSVYLPTLLQDLFQLTAVDAGWRAGVFLVLATLARPLGGYLADRLGAEKVLTVTFAGVVLAAFGLAARAADLLHFSLALLSIAVLIGLGNGAVFKLVPLVARGETGAVTGVVGAAGGLGGFFPPVLLGVVRQATGGYAPGFVLLALYALACFVLNDRHFVRRPQPRVA
ncbi:MAG TPA: MFS transporter [Thermaerobacter sp.]